MNEIYVSVIGCGARGREVMANLLSAGQGRVHIAAVYDPDAEAVEAARHRWNLDALTAAPTPEEAIADARSSLVAIFTPNARHCEMILAALAAGKRVFSEKPLATTLEQCRRIIEAEKRAGIRIMTGFVLRYSPIYRKLKELLDSGTFGNILNIAASEHRLSFAGGNSMSADYGWRRFRDQAGPYLLEKCCHDFDLLNWFAGGLPNRVAGFAGLDFFVPKYTGLWDKYNHDVFAAMVPEQHRINPFTSDKDIFDNHSVILEYPGGIKATFTLTLANAIPERRMYISCTEGTIIVNSDEYYIRYRRYSEYAETTLRYAPTGSHGGGDAVMARELASALLHGGQTEVSGSSNALDCALVALAADESMRTGKIVSLEDMLR
jgi:predicted dehydrogenase